MNISSGEKNSFSAANKHRAREDYAKDNNRTSDANAPTPRPLRMPCSQKNARLAGWTPVVRMRTATLIKKETQWPGPSQSPIPPMHEPSRASGPRFPPPPDAGKCNKISNAICSLRPVPVLCRGRLSNRSCTTPPSRPRPRPPPDSRPSPQGKTHTPPHQPPHQPPPPRPSPQGTTHTPPPRASPCRHR